MLRLICLSVCISLATMPAPADTRPVPTPVPATPGSSDNRDAPTPGIGPRLAQVAVVPGGRRAEWALFGSPAEVAQAETALAAAGVRLLRRRGLPGFARQLTVVDLGSLSPATAVALAAPARVAPNAIYRYAQGASAPRLYAARLTGDRGCLLPAVSRVGIIDGPVDAAHPALAGARSLRVHTRAAGQAAARDAHGTAVAALLVGDGSHGGFARGATLFAADAFSQDRGAPAADVDRIGGALDWLARNRVAVVNMSFAGPRNPVLEELLALAGARMLLVAATGNSGGAAALWPAASPHVVAVTAVDAAGRAYRRATTGPHVEVSAPGVDIWVARSRGGGYASGTSYAAPVVTAFAARLLARGQGREAARRTLSRNVRDLGPPGRDSLFGHGLAVAPGC